MFCPSCHRRVTPFEIYALGSNDVQEVCPACGFAGSPGSFSSDNSPPPVAERTAPLPRPFGPSFGPSLEEMVQRKKAREAALKGAHGPELLAKRAEWAARQEVPTPLQVRFASEMAEEAKNDLLDLLAEFDQ